MKTVLFVLPYPPNQAPSQRFRVEAYFPLLKQNNIKFHCQYFLDQEAWRALYKQGSVFKKSMAVFKGVLKRKFLLLKIHRYDYIFIHREAASVGPPFFEWFVSKVFRKKIIFDFDDAIWIPNVSENNRMARYIKSFWKIRYICKWAHKISAGNQYLLNWVSQYNKNLVLNPTCVDMHDKYVPVKTQSDRPLVIGWTGSHSTMKYLDIILPVLKRLEKKHDFVFMVISNENPKIDLQSFRFLPWKEATEIRDLMNFHIGIMPLENDAWSEGKCGFKIIQYLSLGIPAVASPVGVNTTIIDQSQSGFLCSGEEEWESALELLIQDEQKRSAFGSYGKHRMQHNFSIESNSSNFLSLFSS